MAWLTVDRSGIEKLHLQKPLLGEDSLIKGIWLSEDYVELREFSIYTLLRRHLHYNDEPVEI